MGQGWVDFLGLCEVFFLIEIPWGRSYPYRLCFSYMSPDNVTQKVHDNNNLNMEGVYEFLLALQVSVRVAGGLLFELLGQSVGDPDNEEEDIPIVLRSSSTKFSCDCNACQRPFIKYNCVRSD
jgi:hypothetical protein